MKRAILSASIIDDKICRQFAVAVINNAFEDCDLNVGFRLANRTIMFIVFHDEDRTAPHFSHNVPYADVLEIKDNEEEYADLIDEVVNTLRRKSKQAL